MQYQNDSPMQRMASRNAVALAPSEVALAGDEQTELKEILASNCDFVPDPSFSKANAYRKLFEQAPEIPQPNTSWYHPVMEDLGTERNLKTVVNVVLTAKQEQALFLQFNYARYRVAKLRKQIGDQPVSNDQARDMLKWHRLSAKLRDQIAQSNLALVLAMAKRVRHSDMDFADLISEGNMALLRAIDKFNVARGFKFSTYACRAILKAFSRSGMKQSQYRQLFPTDFDPALERSDFQKRKIEGHEGDCAEEVARIVASNRAGLTDVEQSVINHRFALNRNESTIPLTLEQVGQIVGLTKERVRQIQNKALDKIRATLEAEFIDGSLVRPAYAGGPEEEPILPVAEQNLD
jgi:RNA polymerase sigma factor (sigma-70 family)